MLSSLERKVVCIEFVWGNVWFWYSNGSRLAYFHKLWGNTQYECNTRCAIDSLSDQLTTNGKLQRLVFIIPIRIKSATEPESWLIFCLIVTLYTVYCVVNFQLVYRYEIWFLFPNFSRGVVLRKREISNSSRTEATTEILKTHSDMEIVNQENQL